jgi:Tfp pilus assembly protein PilX
MARLLRREDGFAMPTVLVAIIVGTGLAGVAVTSSIHAQRGTDRDTAAKRALAVADAGAEVAIYRQNKVATTDTLRCVDETLTGGLVPGMPEADGWCEARTDDVAEGSYTYRVKPWTVVGTVQSGLKRELKVVSVGTVDGVSRRVAITAGARTGVNVTNGVGAVGDEGVTIEGSANIGSEQVPTDSSTNGAITTEGSGQLCGNAHVGAGFTFEGNQCAGYGSDNTQVELPPVDPGNVWNSNDNDRFFAHPVLNPDGDPRTGGPSSVTWDESTRTLTLGGNGTLTVGGENYSLCRLVFNGGGTLIVAHGAVVNLFFHSPETCAAETGLPASEFANPVHMTGNARIGTTSSNSGDLRIMVVGSETTPTTATFYGNARQGALFNFTVYAPQTDVFLQGNPTYEGVVAAQTLTVGGSSNLIMDESSLGADISVALNYARAQYVECTGGAMPSQPDTSC